MIRVGINGFGRIGRCILRAAFEYDRKDIEIVAINASATIDEIIHYMKYDSVHGNFLDVKKISDYEIAVCGKKVRLLNNRDPLQLKWGELEIDVVMECTGKFTHREDAAKHIEAGAKKVIISAPAKDSVPTIVYGVNNHVLKGSDKVISIGSCTTNCLAPVAKILNDNVGIKHGFMTTIHAYTNDQNILDGSHKDLRRSRACAMSMIPTSTGAAKALGLVLPELAGKLDGTAIRVPTPNVSFVDLSFVAEKNTTAEEINQMMKNISNNEMKNILGYCDEPLVSIDFNHNPHSSIFDSSQTKVIDGNFVRIGSWYDNEWGFSVRMLDVAVMWFN